MRRVIIWILVIILVFGFVYVGNSIITSYANPGTTLLEYIPEVPFLLKFSRENLQTVGAFYSFPNFISSLEFNRAYIIDDDSPLFAFNTTKDVSEELQTITETLKSQNKFTLKEKWGKGFHILYAYDTNEKYFISEWRNFIFLSNSSDMLNLMFNGITGQGKRIINDHSFEKLWDKNNSFEGFVKDDEHNILKDKMSIPFYRFSYPISFTMNDNKIQMYFINNQNIENSLIPAYHFENEIAEISSRSIIPAMDDSGLSNIFRENTGIFYDKFAVVFSNIPSELVFYKDNKFSLIFSSNPQTNAKLSKQLRVLLPDDVRVKSKTLDNYTITQYFTEKTNVYILTTPNLFIISTEKMLPETITTNNFKNAILFIKTNKSFNNIISFYDLFLDKLTLPNDFTQCSLTETNSTKEGIVKVEINFN